MTRRTLAGVLAVYSAAAIAITWPLALHLTDRIGALQDVGDPFLNLWILGWGLHAWTTDPASVFSGRVFDANIFFPAENTLAYSDHFLLQSLVLSPVYALTGNATLCYNLLVIGSIALSGMAMHALARAVTGSTPGAFVAGLAWACWPYRTAHLLHIQLQALYLMPLALLCLHRVAAARRWRDVATLSAVAALQGIASVYYGLMTGVALATSALVLAVTTGQGRSRRLWTRLAATGIAAIVLTLPLLIPYARSQQVEGFGRTLFEAANHSAAVQSYTQAPPVNLLYGTTGLLAPRWPGPGERDRRSVEHQMFPGLIVVALAALGLWRGLRSDARALALSSAALTVVGVILSFGPEGLRGLYAALHANVYGFQAIRAPARFSVIAMSGLALLAALGMRHLMTPRARPLLAGALVSLMMLEYVNAPLPLANTFPRTTPVGQWLKEEPLPGAVVHLPLTIDIENTPFMVQSLEHWRPIVNGYSGQRPVYYSALVDALADLPSADAFTTLKELEVRFVVSPAVIAGAGNPSSPLVERARLPGGVIYELRWTEAATAALEEPAGVEPPPPGPIPFAAGETAVYDVFWDGGPLNIAAGRAELRVAGGQAGSDPWTFEATADTASWVSRFFQARDRFRTIADALLQPIEHAREIREGRRQIDRTYLFDREARVVRVGESRDDARDAGALVLPLGNRAARDGLAALYYVRTLPLEPGAVVTVPMNEAGTSLVLQLPVAEIESIDQGGARVPALRLEPRLMRRIERRRPLTLTVWLSTDARRVPLRVIVEAGFGRVRAELVDYRR